MTTETDGTPAQPEPHPVELMAIRGGPMAGDGDDSLEAERLRFRNHTEELIESEARRYLREGFCTDIEQARRESREAMWPFA